jgi:hypothetical protein
VFSTLFCLFPFGAGNIPVALGFTFYHKHHVASGILTVAILTSIWMAHDWEQPSLYGVQQSGKSFSSAAKQDVRHVFRGESSHITGHYAQYPAFGSRALISRAEGSTQVGGALGQDGKLVVPQRLHGVDLSGAASSRRR